MAKRSREVKRFMGAASLRLTEAERLRDLGLTLAAVYLAGYAVECVLKALLLAATPEHKQLSVVAEFRGQNAHNFRWLLDNYRSAGGASHPRDVAAALFILGSWEPALRYSNTASFNDDVAAFFAAVGTVTNWALPRIP